MNKLAMSLAAAAAVTLAAASAEASFRAKNVILMVSDGAGDTTWRAANQWQFGLDGNTAPQFRQRFEQADFTKHYITTFSAHNQSFPPGQVEQRLNPSLPPAFRFPVGSLPRYLPQLYNEIPFPNFGGYDPVRANDTTPGNVHIFTDRTRSLFPGRGTPFTLTPVAANPAPVRTLATLLQQAGTITVNRQTAPIAYDYLIWNSLTDSAAAGTAMASGIKTYNSGINYIDDNGTLRPVTFFTQIARAMGRSTGIVTTKPFTDATPAAFGTTNDFRRDEAEISHDMIHNGLLDVIISPGHPEFGPGGAPRATPSFTTISQPNLQALRSGVDGWTFVDSNAQLMAIASGAQPAPDRLFGLVPVASALNSRDTTGQTNAFDPRIHTPSNIPAGVIPFVMPDLPDLASAALNTLSRDPDGFFALIEGASVDTGAEDNNLPKTIEEQLAFNRAVDRVINWVETNSSWDETLLIVTTDHGTGLFLGPDSDTIPFQQPIATGVGQLPLGMWWTTNHTNELVPLWTRGPGSAMFASLLDGVDPRKGAFGDNTDIFRVMSTVIPEPSTLALLAPAGLLLLRRRK